jgi:uncharacterized protein (TIGR02453 family)
MKAHSFVFSAEGIRFLASLKRNNRREWFQPRKQVFEERVKGPMLELVGLVNTEMLRFAPDYVREPEDAIYRIYRDTRFSPDKTPYKTHIAAIFPRRGLGKHGCAGLYFSVAPEGVEVAGGVYMPDREELRLIREHLAQSHEEFRAIVRSRTLRQLLGEMQGDQLSRPPKGFCADHPAADLVRRKQWLYYVTLPPETATTPGLVTEIVKRFRAMMPFIEFLNKPLVANRRHRTAHTLL